MTTVGEIAEELTTRLGRKVTDPFNLPKELTEDQALKAADALSTIIQDVEDWYVPPFQGSGLNGLKGAYNCLCEMHPEVARQIVKPYKV